MKNRMFVLGMTLAAVSLVTPRVFGETLEEVEKKIVENMSKHKSLSFKTKSANDMKTPDLEFKSTSEGLMEIARRGEDKWVSRMEAKSATLSKVGDNKEEKNESKVLSIYDGEFSYNYSEAGEQKTAMKTKADKKINWDPFDGKAMFEESRKNFELKLLPDETIDGKAVYVIEMTAKKSEGSENAQTGLYRLVNYYRKDNGISVKSLVYDKDGKVTQTFTITDLKIDEELKPDRFVFKAPAGVEVVDMTQTQSQPADEHAAKADKPAPAAENNEQAEAKPKEEPKPKKKGIGSLIDKIK